MRPSGKLERTDDGSTATAVRGTLASRIVILAVFFVGLGAVVGASLALADEATPAASGSPTSSELEEAVEPSVQIEVESTDPEAAGELPHEELDREEAGELLEGVFEPEVKAAAGIYSDLHVEKLLATDVAVVAAGEQPEVPGGSDVLGSSNQGATLLQSTEPLATEGESGELEALNLSLERDDGALSPANPLMEVEIPEELGAGIDMPGPGIKIEPEGVAGVRVPSTMDQSVAFYPNVSSETDLAVSPTLEGVETMAQLRSPESPRVETYRLDLPPGASLIKKGAGALVKRGEESLMTVAPPTTLDAKGAEVPTELSVDGDRLTIEVSPPGEANYPILVDPLFDIYEWYAKHEELNEEGNVDGWYPKQGASEGVSASTGNSMEAFVPYGSKGLDVRATIGGRPFESFWQYTVPGYDHFELGGRAPEAFISHMTLSDVAWRGESEALNPYLYMGLWGPSKGWASLYTHEGLTGHGTDNLTYQYNFPNEKAVPDVKFAEVGISTPEAVQKPWVEVFVGAANIELSEPAASAPEFTELYAPEISGPVGWLNQAASSIHFMVKDAALGTYAVKAGLEGGGAKTWTRSAECSGVAHNPCPFQWRSTVGFEPEYLPTGIDKVQVTAEDPIGHSKSGTVEVSVDHTKPVVTLSGSMTEQETLGTARPSYALKVVAIDGSSAAPQSGVASTKIKIDHEVVDESSPGCTTENCAVTREWTLNAEKYGLGTHTVEVLATDAVGNTTTKTISVQLHPSPPPTLTLSGSLTQQASLGVTRPRYTLVATAAASAQGEIVSAKVPSFVSSFGSAGSAGGQFQAAGGVAVAPKGQIWVSDPPTGRIEEFSASGGYLKQFGSLGTKEGQFSDPSSLAVDASGDVWVVDTGNNRVEEFSEAGVFIRQFGSGGTGNGQFTSPEGIAIDPKGNVWVADRGHGRLEEFNSKGEFLRVVGTKGTGSGQLEEPDAIAIDSKGYVWVASYGDDRVTEFSEAGTFWRQSGTEGSGNDQFVHPDGVAVDAAGHVWVGDTGNDRVEELNEETGGYLGQFGSGGTGRGQFSLARPMGIASDGPGNLLVSDPNNGRVENWVASTPAYASSLGSAGQLKVAGGVATTSSGQIWVANPSMGQVEEFGSDGRPIRNIGSPGRGQGQFTEAGTLAVDASGDIWVVDTGDNRVEEFSEARAFIRQFGSGGTGNGQFASPEGIAIDSKGDVWVCDRGNGRLEEFNSKGEFLKSVGVKGTGAGQLDEPDAIAIDSKGDLWIVNYGSDRVSEFSEAGSYLRQSGTEGSGNGQFVHPDGIALDAAGHVWVGDIGSNRVEELSETGGYLGQFGSKGTGPGQFSLARPMGIASDRQGNLWVSDPNNDRVQRWIATPSPSSVSTEISVDGKLISSSESNCLNTACNSSKEWTLDPAVYSAGTHAVSVTATDGLGRSTTKSLPIEIQRDTKGPELTVTGRLFEAPDGWVEQQEYEVDVMAQDGGAGVATLKLLIDGHQVGIATGSCPDGGCALYREFKVDAAELSGGSHEAEVIATDGASNTTTRRWTVNVDPDGRITAQEEKETLEAVETTSEQTPVAPTDEILSAEEREGGDNPGLAISGSEVTSTGVPDVTTMTTDPEDGLSIESPEGTTTITPVMSETASSTAVVNEVAGVAANVAKEVDSIIRPEYNGVQIAQAIRSEASRETFSWRVHLTPRQKLIQVNPSQAEVAYTDGTEVFLITAEPAHDATGKSVPTSVSVNGDELTVKVEFRGGGFVFPVVAGEGWETSYTVPVIVQGPEDETQIREREEREKREAEERAAAEAGGSEPPVTAPPSPVPPAYAERIVEANMNVGGGIAPPPQPVCHGTCATGSSVVEVFVVSELRDCQIDHCNEWWISIAHGNVDERPKFERGYNWAEWVNHTPYACHFYYNTALAFAGLSINEEGCQLNNLPWKVFKSDPKHLTLWGRFHISQAFGTDVYTGFKENYVALQIHVWPNGYQEPVIRGYSPMESES